MEPHNKSILLFLYLDFDVYVKYLSQLHSEVPSLPKLPELYLEASAALLMARRSADCMVLCSEVISKTLELLPEKAVLEEPEERSGDVSVAGDNKLEMLLWAAAAYLLQGHCYSQLKDWKQAVTQYTRSVNDISSLLPILNKHLILYSSLKVCQPADKGALYKEM